MLLQCDFNKIVMLSQYCRNIIPESFFVSKSQYCRNIIFESTYDSTVDSRWDSTVDSRLDSRLDSTLLWSGFLDSSKFCLDKLITIL